MNIESFKNTEEVFNDSEEEHKQEVATRLPEKENHIENSEAVISNELKREIGDMVAQLLEYNYYHLTNDEYISENPLEKPDIFNDKNCMFRVKMCSNIVGELIITISLQEDSHNLQNIPLHEIIALRLPRYQPNPDTNKPVYDIYKIEIEGNLTDIKTEYEAKALFNESIAQVRNGLSSFYESRQSDYLNTQKDYQNYLELPLEGKN